MSVLGWQVTPTVVSNVNT